MKIDEYFVNIKDWDNLIKINRDRFLLYYKYCNKGYGNKLSHKYSLLVYKTFPSIQCICAGAVIWEFNPKTGRLKIIANSCDEISINKSLELFYKAVLDMEKNVNR